MTHEPQTFTVVDPRTFDGNPYEVAARAVQQAESVAHILAVCLETATIMGRNAEMSRQEHATGDPQAAAWEDSAYGRKFARAHADCKKIERELELLRQAVGYDPKNPPKA
jgi:hypothetical protein